MQRNFSKIKFIRIKKIQSEIVFSSIYNNTINFVQSNTKLSIL